MFYGDTKNREFPASSEEYQVLLQLCTGSQCKFTGQWSLSAINNLINPESICSN